MSLLKNNKLAFYAFLTSSLFISSQSMGDNLNDAVLKALSSHPSVVAQENKTKSVYEAIKEERAALFPTVSVNTSFGKLYGDNSTSRGLSVERGAGVSGLWDGSITLRQKVYDFGGVGSRVNSAKHKSLGEDFLLINAKERIAFTSVQAYLNVLKNREIHKNAQDNFLSLKEYHNKIKHMLDNSVVSEDEYNLASDVLFVVEKMLRDSEQQKKLSEYDYEEITGDRPSLELSLPDKVVLQLSVDDAVSLSIKGHPQLRSLWHSTESSKYDTEFEKSGLLPSVNSEFSYSKKDQRDVIGGESTDARAILKASWSFNFGGAQTQRIKIKQRVKHENIAREKELMRMVEKNIRYSYAEMEAASVDVDIAKKREDISKKLLSTYVAQFEVSKVSLLDLLNAENNVSIVKMAAINSEYRKLLAGYSVLSSMGQLRNSFVHNKEENK